MSSLKYRCFIKDSLDIWITEGKIYDVHHEIIIPPITPDESWLKILVADDGYPAFVRAKQMQRVFDNQDEMNV